MEGIINLFGDLIIKKDGKYYLSRKTSFSKYPLELYFRSLNYIGLQTYERVNNNGYVNNLLDLTLYREHMLSGMYIEKGGSITISKDYKLSGKECMFFNSHNIIIKYFDENNDLCLYDMENIIRTYTINNIIK